MYITSCYLLKDTVVSHIVHLSTTILNVPAVLPVTVDRLLSLRPPKPDFSFLFNNQSASVSMARLEKDGMWDTFDFSFASSKKTSKPSTSLIASSVTPSTARTVASAPDFHFIFRLYDTGVCWSQCCCCCSHSRRSESWWGTTSSQKPYRLVLHVFQRQFSYLIYLILHTDKAVVRVCLVWRHHTE